MRRGEEKPLRSAQFKPSCQPSRQHEQLVSLRFVIGVVQLGSGTDSDSVSAAASTSTSRHRHRDRHRLSLSHNSTLWPHLRQQLLRVAVKIINSIYIQRVAAAVSVSISLYPTSSRVSVSVAGYIVYIGPVICQCVAELCCAFSQAYCKLVTTTTKAATKLLCFIEICEMWPNNNNNNNGRSAY